MDLYEELKATAAKFNDTTEVFLFKEVRGDRETFENAGNSVVFIYTDFQETTTIQNNNLITVGRYTIDFLDIDTWDNRDNDNKSEQVHPSSYEIYKTMRVFANGVLRQWLNDYPAAIRPGATISWVHNPKFRIFSNPMSGTRVTLTAPFRDQGSCPN